MAYFKSRHVQLDMVRLMHEPGSFLTFQKEVNVDRDGRKQILLSFVRF